MARAVKLAGKVIGWVVVIAVFGFIGVVGVYSLIPDDHSAESWTGYIERVDDSNGRWGFDVPTFDLAISTIPVPPTAAECFPLNNIWHVGRGRLREDPTAREWVDRTKLVRDYFARHCPKFNWEDKT